MYCYKNFLPAVFEYNYDCVWPRIQIYYIVENPQIIKHVLVIVLASRFSFQVVLCGGELLSFLI